MRLINRLIKWNEQSKTSLRYQSERSASGGGWFGLQSKIRLRWNRMKNLIFDWRMQIEIGQKECNQREWRGRNDPQGYSLRARACSCMCNIRVRACVCLCMSVCAPNSHNNSLQLTNSFPFSLWERSLQQKTHEFDEAKNFTFHLSQSEMSRLTGPPLIDEKSRFSRTHQCIP